MPVKGIYLAGAGIGSVMLYAGFKGKKWTDVTHGLLSGQSPQDIPQTYGITTSSAAFNATGYGAGAAGYGTSASGDAIVQDALKYKGAGYVWAGAPGNGAGNWDCSSFCNAVIGRDLHMAIPMYKAGTYHGQAHGPNTLIWLAWPGAKKVSQPAAGVLAIWTSHMGICINGTQMISALNGTLGTQVTGIQAGGPKFEPLVFKAVA
jgi:cell wall-associated NlpC family hydrolase